MEIDAERICAFSFEGSKDSLISERYFERKERKEELKLSCGSYLIWVTCVESAYYNNKRLSQKRYKIVPESW